jgi:hypothetical protein
MEQNKELKDIRQTLGEYSDEMDFLPQEPEIDPLPKKKETRGRKPGSGKRKQAFEEPPPTQLQASDLISGTLLLMFIDLAIPNIISFVNNRYSKKKIKAKAMQMNDKQKSELEPFANEAAKQLLIKGNPVTVFIIALAGIYGLNFMMLKNE